MSNSGERDKGRFRKGVSGNPSGLPKPAAEGATEQSNADGTWSSALTNIGTERDKRHSHQLRVHRMTYEEIARHWEADDVTAKAIEAPADECFREGYEIVIPNEIKYKGLKDDILERIRELGVNEALKRNLYNRRAFGGGVTMLGVDDGRPLSQPLDPAASNLKFDWLNSLEPIEIYPATFYQDPLKAKYNEPELYQLNPQPRMGFGPTTQSTNAQQQYVHESRLVVHQGIVTSKFFRGMLSEVSPYWGASVVPRFYEILRDHGVAFGAASILPIDISQPVISIKGLKGLIAMRAREFQQRMAALELGRSVARTVMLDMESEKFERQTTQLSGIPELLDRLSQRLAAAVDIPLSILLGYSPASLGSPGSSEMTQWYNRIRAIQRDELTPRLLFIINLIVKTLRVKKIPTNIQIRWHELEHLSELQQAELRLTNWRSDSLAIKSGVVWPQEIRTSRYHGGYSSETQIDESKDAPGFLSPLPAGVIPGSTPAAAVVQAQEAGMPIPGAPAAGANSHAVGGYTRRDPAQPAVKAAPVGGDTAGKLDADGLEFVDDEH